MTLQRRALLAALVSSGPCLARAATRQDAIASSYRPYAGPFNPRFSGELATPSLPVEGRLPAGLRGTFYRNGPGRMQLGSTAYSHWFDGDGMVQAFTFDKGTVGHRGVLLRTPKLLEEEAAGRFLYPAFGTSFPHARSVRNPDAVNVANINLMAMDGGRQLYALWEGGSAVSIDPRSLAVRGFKAWSDETAGAPFSAHPRIGADGTVWNFGYMAGSGKLIVYEIAPDGKLRRQAVLAAPQADMVHDFAMTERYLVFLLMPLAYRGSEDPSTPFIARFQWDGGAPLVAMILDKADFSARRFELPNGGVYHLGNAWEESGSIRLAYARHPDLLDTMQALSSDRMGEGEAWTDASWTEVRLDLQTGRAIQREVEGLRNIEFPTFDGRHTGGKTAFTLLMQRSARMSSGPRGYDTVVALRGGRVDRFTYSGAWLAEEHIFVPRSGAAKEGAGWVLGTAYEWRRERTVLSVFDAADLSAGPLARMELPYALPLGLHGKFVDAAS